MEIPPHIPSVQPIPATPDRPVPMFLRGCLLGFIIWVCALPILPTLFIVGPVVYLPLMGLEQLFGIHLRTCDFICAPNALGMGISLIITMLLFGLLNLALIRSSKGFRIAAYLIVFVTFWVVALALPSPRTLSEPPSVSPSEQPAAWMSESEARAIAEQTCIKGGEALGPGSYNPTSHTWWFDANLNATRPGCNPACVVFEGSGTAEINWRCTGLIVPSASPTHSISPVMCTADAMQCPDGTWVGRTGPRCEFVCP